MKRREFNNIYSISRKRNWTITHSRGTEKRSSVCTSSKSTPHSAAMFRIKSEALESAAKIKSWPESTKSKIPSKSNDPPKPTKISQLLNPQIIQQSFSNKRYQSFIPVPRDDIEKGNMKEKIKTYGQ